MYRRCNRVSSAHGQRCHPSNTSKNPSNVHCRPGLSRSGFSASVIHVNFKIQAQERLNLLAVLLRDEASDWYNSLDGATRATWSVPRTLSNGTSMLPSCCVGERQVTIGSGFKVLDSVDSHNTGVKKLVKAIGVEDEQLPYAIQRDVRRFWLTSSSRSRPRSMSWLNPLELLRQHPWQQLQRLPRFHWTMSSQSWQQTG